MVATGGGAVLLRSPLDPVLVIHKGDGAGLASNDDSGGPDAYLRWAAPAVAAHLPRLRLPAVHRAHPGHARQRPHPLGEAGGPQRHDRDDRLRPDEAAVHERPVRMALAQVRHQGLSLGARCVAILVTHGDIFVEGARQAELMTFLNVYRKVGGAFDVQEDGIRFWHPGGDLKPVTIETDVHPGFMTDWQQPLIDALTQAQGTSIVHETVYENRFGFTEALREMGANIVVHPNGLPDHPRRVARRDFEQAAVIVGPTELHGADIRVPDLRGGFSHLIAALSADGQSKISNVGIISRGYEHIIEKLATLGADFVYEG